MRTISRIFSILTIAFIGVATGQQSIRQRDAQRVLPVTVPRYSVKATNVLEAAAQVASDFNLPIGIEWGGDIRAKKEVSHEWQNTTVEQILRDIASFDVEYQLEFSNGVAHLTKIGLTDSPRNPLNIRMPSFTTEDTYPREAAFKLSDQVGFVMFPRQKENRSACGGSYAAGAGERRLSISMTDSSARGILDALLTRSELAMWVVVFPDQQPETGYLKTESLWGNKTDIQHPDLTLVARYVDPVTGSYRSDWEIGLRKR